MGHGTSWSPTPRSIGRDTPDDRTQHINDIRFGGEVHNKKMERMNGEIRDREKVMRGVKQADPYPKGISNLPQLSEAPRGLER